MARLGRRVPRDLGYAEVTSNPVAATATVPTAVAGLAVTVTKGSGAVRIIFHAYQAINTNATFGVGTFSIYRDGTRIGRAALSFPANLQFGGWPVDLIVRDNAAAPGQHTYEVRQNIETAGQSVNLLAVADSPAFISVTEL